MALVEPRVLEKLQQQQQFSRPTIVESALNNLDQEMQDILSRTDISSEDKLDQYNKTLHKYLMYDRKREPMKIQLVQNKDTIETPMADAVEHVEEKNDIEEEIIEAAPKMLQNKARLLLKRLRKDPNINWNSRGELIYKGGVVSHSHINDLIQDVLRSRKHHVPNGWQTFATALKESNIPQDLIGNQDRWQWMHHEPQSTVSHDAVAPAGSSKTSSHKNLSGKSSKDTRKKKSVYLECL